MCSIRKLVSKLILTVGVLCLMTVSAAAHEGPQIAYEAETSSNIALMSAESNSADTVRMIPSGKTLVLLSSYTENDWVAASYLSDDGEGYTGYIYARDLNLQAMGESTVLSSLAIIRQSAHEEATPVTMLTCGEQFNVLGYNRGWFYVEANGFYGYLPLEEVNCTMEVTGRVNFREGAGTDSLVLSKLDKGTILTPLYSDGEWVKVSYEGETGYVSTDYLKAADYSLIANPGLSNGQDVVDFASQYLGNRYVWGGESLENGCDCSGYVMLVYREFGVELPHSSYSMRQYGEKVDYEDMVVGDVVCYDGHVGIYAGDGQIINALNSRVGICYTNVNYAPIITIRRLL